MYWCPDDEGEELYSYNRGESITTKYEPAFHHVAPKGSQNERDSEGTG